MSIANANLHHLTQPSTQLVNFIGPPNMVAIPQSQGQFVLAVQPNSWASTVGTSTISNAATMDCQFPRISQDKQTSSKIIADNSVSIVSGNNFLSSQQAPFNNPNASSQETTDRIVATGSTIPSSNQLVAPMSFSTSNFIQSSTLLGTGPPHILTTGQQPSTTLVQQANGQYILASRINTVPQSGQVSSVGAFASGNPDSISTGPSTGPLLMSTNGPASNSVGTSSEDLASRQLITTSSTVSPINQLVQVILANGQLATTTLANLQACGLASPNLSLNQPTLPTGPSVGQISYFSPTNSGLIQPGSVQQQASAPLQTQLIADSSGQLFAVSSPPTMYNSLLPSNLTTIAPLNSGQSPQYVQIATPGGIVLVSADQVQNISTQQSLASSSSSSILSSNVPLSVNHSNNTADSEKNNTNQTGCNQINPIDSNSPQIQQVTNLSERVKQTKTTANGNSRFLSRLTNIEQTGTSKTNPYDTSNRVITTIICGASKTPDIESDGQISQATQVSLSPSNSSSPTDISSSPHASQSTVSSTTVISTHDQSSNSSSTRPLTLAATTTATNLMSDDQTTIYRSISVESQTLSSASPLSIGSASMEPESTTHSSATVANTINNTDATVVDGVNLEEIKEFARQFKIRRLSLGLTQTQVGQALSATEGPSYSQSAICRFEKLDITPKSAQKIKPILEQWMQEAEDRYKSGNNNLTDFIGSDSHKKRKRRTSFTPSALEILNAFFEKNTHPSGSEMTALADRLRYDREVVRVWFCNKRQALRNTVKKVEPSNTIIT